MTELKQKGFTIVELLIVIVVIAILAAITIIAYNGISTRAKIVTIQSDLSNDRTLIESSNASSGTYPGSTAAAGLKSSPGNTVNYFTALGRYCVTVSNASIPSVYRVSSTNNIGLGTCWTVSSYVNNGQGSADGASSVAQFNIPQGIAFDAAGNLYVADSANHRIRVVSPSGIVSTLAGSTPGNVDGTTANAKFNYPGGVAVDSSGNVFVADSDNHSIRKITPGGAVSTFAGSTSGVAGATNGTGTAARFNYPEDIAIDSVGNIYVADTYNHTIRKINSAGVVTSLAGQYSGFNDGTGTAASFSYPQQLSVDLAGNVYVADTNNCAIRIVSPAGVVTTLAGSATCGDQDGIGSAAKLNRPNAIVLGNDNAVYITDTNNNKIKRVLLDGTVTTIAGNGGQGNTNGAGEVAQFSYPAGIAFDVSGNIYVSDQLNNGIRKLNL